MTTKTRPWKTQDTIDANPIGLSEKACAALIPELDAHLASLFVMFHQYQKHHWLVEGPQFRDLHLLLESSYTAIHEHVDAVAERITALGGVPTSDPANLASRAYFKHEPEGVFRVRDMLQRDCACEGEIATRLRETIALAGKHNDYGTERLLKTVLAAAEERAHHLDHFLGDDSLTIGLDASAASESRAAKTN